MTRLYHNTRCSKSRGALELLRERGIEPEVVYYLETPPSPAELREMLRMLGIPARGLVRTGEPAYTELGLDEASYELMSLKVPLIRMPVATGRNLAILVEVAARNQLLRMRGINAARELVARLDASLENAAPLPSAAARGDGGERRRDVAPAAFSREGDEDEEPA